MVPGNGGFSSLSLPAHADSAFTPAAVTWT
jgi:hypothetical protein